MARRRLKKLPETWRDRVVNEIKMLLHASRDCLRNQDKDTLRIRFSSMDAYYGEAFGVMRALVLLDYGYFGSSNLNAVKEYRSEIPEHNLKWWFGQLESEVLEEEGFHTDHVCLHCKDRYGKDDASLIERGKLDPENGKK